MGCFIGFRGVNFSLGSGGIFECSTKHLSFKGVLVANSGFVDFGNPRRDRILAVFYMQGTMFGKCIGVWDGKA
jgi:hypothetical protein